MMRFSRCSVNPVVATSALLEQVIGHQMSRKKRRLFRKLWGFFEGDLAGKNVAIWGCRVQTGTARLIIAPVLTLL